MADFLSVHGYDPGPSQRPLLAGAISGVLATAPAIAVLLAFGSLEVEARILGMSTLLTLCLGWAAMAVAGAIYAQLFGRAANNVRGGWLFGMVFGFALWAGGAVLVLPILSGGRAPAGQRRRSALPCPCWSGAWRSAFCCRSSIGRCTRASRRARGHPELGPNAAAGKEQPVREQSHGEIGGAAQRCGVSSGTRASVRCV